MVVLPLSVVSLVIAEDDSPLSDPKEPDSAGSKSPVDMPCRYISGRASATLRVLRHQGGRIELFSGLPASSCRLSPTRRA